MVQYCAVPNCKSSGFTEGIAFHVFPRDPTRFKQWKAKVRRDDRFSPTTQAMRICSKHFVESDYRIVPSGFKFLKKDAVPSIFTFTSPRKLKRPRRRVQYKSDIMDFEFVGLCAPIDLEEDFKVESRDETENEKSSTQIKIEPFSLEFTEADTNTCPDDVKLKSEIEIHDDVIGPVSEPLASSLVEIENKTDIHNDSRQIKQDPLSFEITEADTNACPDDSVHSNLKRDISLEDNREDTQKIHVSHAKLRRRHEEQDGSAMRKCSEIDTGVVSCLLGDETDSKNKVSHCSATRTLEERSEMLADVRNDGGRKKSRGKGRRGRDACDKSVKFSCSFCPEDFKTKQSLLLHVVKFHRKQVAYTCNVCKKEFKEASQLNFHIKTHYVGLLHSCRFCGNVFLDKLSLNRHVMKHNGEKLFRCVCCGEYFRELAAIKRHIKSHSEGRQLGGELCT